MSILVGALLDDDDAELKAAADALSALCKNSEGIFHKGLTLFNTGIAFVRAVESALESHRRDAPHVKTLGDLVVASEKVAPLELADISSAKGDLHVKEKEKRAMLCKQFTMIIANTSMSFQKRNSTSCDRIDKHLVATVESFNKYCKNEWLNCMTFTAAKVCPPACPS